MPKRLTYFIGKRFENKMFLLLLWT